MTKSALFETRAAIVLALLTAIACGADDRGSTVNGPGNSVGDSEAGDDGNGDETASPDDSGADGTDGDAGDGDGDGGSSGAGDDGDTGDDGNGDDGCDALPSLDPPACESSGGSGGTAAQGGPTTTAGGVQFYLHANGDPGPHPLLVVYSGIEGGVQMSQNFNGPIMWYGLEKWVIAVLDGAMYNGNGQAGADVIDFVRSQYDIDNDQTYLLSESAGTTAGLQLGLQLRQSYFAAYWANDIIASGVPAASADELGFAPYGNAGPGGNFQDAQVIVDGMKAAGYRVPGPAPYDGPGSGQHGNVDQFNNGIQWLIDKSRL